MLSRVPSPILFQNLVVMSVHTAKTTLLTCNTNRMQANLDKLGKAAATSPSQISFV